MNVNLFFNWLWIGELLTFKTGPPCIFKQKKHLFQSFYYSFYCCNPVSYLIHHTLLSFFEFYMVSLTFLNLIALYYYRENINSEKRLVQTELMYFVSFYGPDKTLRAYDRKKLPNLWMVFCLLTICLSFFPLSWFGLSYSTINIGSLLWTHYRFDSWKGFRK